VYNKSWTPPVQNDRRQSLPSLRRGRGLHMSKKNKEINRKEHELIQIEIENYKQNIDFYRDQILSMEEKIEELEGIRKSVEY